MSSIQPAVRAWSATFSEDAQKIAVAVAETRTLHGHLQIQVLSRDKCRARFEVISYLNFCTLSEISLQELYDIGLCQIFSLDRLTPSWPHMHICLEKMAETLKPSMISNSKLVNYQIIKLSIISSIGFQDWFCSYIYKYSQLTSKGLRCRFGSCKKTLPKWLESH